MYTRPSVYGCGRFYVVTWQLQSPRPGGATSGIGPARTRKKFPGDVDTIPGSDRQDSTSAVIQAYPSSRSTSSASSPPLGETGVKLLPGSSTSPAPDETLVLAEGGDSPGVVALVDWLQGTIRWEGGLSEDIVPVLKTWAEAHWRCELVPTGRAVRGWYEKSFAGPGGLRLAWSPGEEKDGGRPEVYLELPAEALHLVANTAEEYLELFDHLRAWSFRPSRIDLTVDDYLKRVTPARAREAADLGQITGFKRDENGRYAYKFYTDGRTGASTFSLGSRGSKGSGKQLCIYEKGERTRLELRLADTKARQVWGMLEGLDGSPELLAPLIGGVLVGAVSFDTGPDSGRVGSRELLPWWEELTANFIQGRIRLAAKKKPEPTAERSRRWFERAVAPSLATFRLVADRLGDQRAWGHWMNSLLSEGKGRQSSRHQTLEKELYSLLASRSLLAVADRHLLAVSVGFSPPK